MRNPIRIVLLVQLCDMDTVVWVMQNLEVVIIDFFFSLVKNQTEQMYFK